MLSIREEQMEVFRQFALENFETEMVEHSQEFAPRLCKVLGEKQLRIAIRHAITKAESYGFTNIGPVRLYIDLMFMYGSSFDTDPQYKGLGEILNASGEQMERAEQLYEYILDYEDKVTGAKNINLIAAFKNLSSLARENITLTSGNFEGELLQHMEKVFPEKVAYVGKESLGLLIYEGRVEAQRFDFPKLRGEALIVMMMFVFGYGCTRSPLCPWVLQTLTDRKAQNSEIRASQLGKVMLRWLDFVLGRSFV